MKPSSRSCCSIAWPSAIGVAAWALSLWLPTAAMAEEAAAAVTPEQEKFFEEKVRPILAANCLDCHGAKKQESGLRLDARQTVLAGGDSGEPIAVPGDPERSLLIQAVNHAGDYHMPPEGKLADEQIAALTEWVRQGLPWPAGGQTVAPTLGPAELANEHRQSHWAYQPVVHPPLPEIPNAESKIQNPIDTFIVARLAAAGLGPSGEADRRTLIRRLNYDLLGLPPTPEEVEAFASDTSPDAYERLVDRLLASPRYGERWGRHWLDVARYADTKGYAFARERRYPYAYTYRDYVIRAFNQDLPYNRFLVEQLAADRVVGESEQEKASLAALGFLTTGRKFNNRHDDIDDQIDAVTRGLMGITVACARCHDHKYDAIPTEDYYSLYGVFASCTEPDDLPLIGPPEEGEAYRKFEEELKKRQAELDQFVSEKHGEYLDQARRQAADYLARVAAGETNTLLAKLPFLSLDPKDLRPGMIQRWRKYLDENAKPDHAALGLWHDLLKVSGDDFPTKAAPVLERWLALPEGIAAGQINPRVKAAFAEDTPATRMDVPRIYGQLLTVAYDEWKQAGADEKTLEKLPEDARQLATILLGKDSPTDLPKDDLRQFLSRADRNKHSELKKKIETFQATSPAAPPRAMIVADQNPHDARVLIRGNPARQGKSVPRQFLLVLAGEERQPFGEGSGRLELAERIAAPENPLTRRVIANRLWMHHFGEPLALSPSDFGVRSETPTHPELLDYLAAELLIKDWSLKSLHRQMVESATYRQVSLDRPDCRAEDPENRLLWRMNRRRLELEAVRDTLLAVAGRLDSTMFGRPVELTTVPFTQRRAVYGYIDRQDLPGMFRVFDIASPDQSSPRRPRTTVPQQALFFMNSPFVVEQSQALAARPEVAEPSEPAVKMEALYRLIFARTPTDEERAIGRHFVETCGEQTADGMRLSPWEQYAQLLLLTNEVMYVD